MSSRLLLCFLIAGSAAFAAHAGPTHKVLGRAASHCHFNCHALVM